MSRGFRNSDETKALDEKVTSEAINAILERDREQASHAAEVRANGRYGLCEDCGRTIGDERMEALPTATRCVRCQSEWEQTNRI